MDVDDDMNMLAITSSAAAGRVWASMSTQKSKSAASLSLREILSYKGTEKLFDDLLDRYSCPSISGVQPKVVVTEDVNATFDKTYLEKSAIKSPDLIIKSAGSQYPGLAENEFICMSIAKHVGLKTPEFFLSQDRNLFVIRRFDVSESGYLGFEDLAALTGRHPDQKYHGSYADIAKAISLNVATANRASSLDGFFRLLVVCCLLRNGDAHLKNFGVLYGDPSTASEDARLAPVYDVICSTIYIKNDVLALGLSGSKSWPTRAVLEKFGSHHCAISSPRQVIEETVEKAMGYRPSDELPMWPEIRAEMESGVAAINAAKGPTRGTSTASS